ncbi:DivIVA domain-containing protein [Streptococcus agalactiae]|uniref:DivIVA domain-containing protein n=1 Tax=Streptococcus agalactiae TaxID=1311 RepID=UPI003C7332E6
MPLTALEIKDKTFSLKFRGYSEEEVNEFLDIVVDDYEDLIRRNREQEQYIKDLEDKVAYFDEMKESLSQSVILAQETAERVKVSAQGEASNVMGKATFDAQHLIDEAKLKANQILRDATDEAKHIAIETEDLKRQSRVFHQRLLSELEGQLKLANSSVWEELLRPTAIYLKNSDASFKEVVEKVLDEDDALPVVDGTESFDATRQFSPDEMEELQRRVEESNRNLEESGLLDIDFSAEKPINLGETQTFKLNIED